MAADKIVLTSSPTSIALGYKLMDPGPNQYYAPIVYVEGGGGGGGGGVEPTTDPDIVYGTDDAGDPKLFDVSPTGVADTIALRTDTGTLRASTLPFDDADAANEDLVNRQYFDEGLSAFADEFMVAKTADPGIVYGTNIDDGALQYYPISVAPAPDSVVLRTAEASMLTETPADADAWSSTQDVVSRGYADAKYLTMSSDPDMMYTVASDGSQQMRALPVNTLGMACSDEVTPIEEGVALTFRMPYDMLPTKLRASLTTAQTSGVDIEIDVTVNGVSILSTPLTIESGQKSSTASDVPFTLVPDMLMDDDAEIVVTVDQIGDGTAAGLKLFIVGR